MTTQYVSTKHRTMFALATELRRIADLLDDVGVPIEPTLLDVSMLVETEDEAAAATIDLLHGRLFASLPVYERTSGHYRTSYDDTISGQHTWIRVFGETIPPDRIVAEAWDAAHAEQAERMAAIEASVADLADSGAGAIEVMAPSPAPGTSLLGRHRAADPDEPIVAEAFRRVAESEALASAILDPDAPITRPCGQQTRHETHGSHTRHVGAYTRSCEGWANQPTVKLPAVTL